MYVATITCNSKICMCIHELLQHTAVLIMNQSYIMHFYNASVHNIVVHKCLGSVHVCTESNLLHILSHLIWYKSIISYPNYMKLPISCIHICMYTVYMYIRPI